MYIRTIEFEPTRKERNVMYGKMSASFAASVLRGLVISGILIFLLPITLGADAV